MQGSISQPDLCLYVSAVQAFKAHQPQSHHTELTLTAPTEAPATPTTGHSAMRRWLAWLVPSPSQ